mgnify:CR=1 FL=1
MANVLDNWTNEKRPVIDSKIKRVSKRAVNCTEILVRHFQFSF